MSDNTCYGCADNKRTVLGKRTSGRTSDPVFTDSRTGRSFCHECIACLVTWELDGCPEPDECPYPEWLGENDDSDHDSQPEYALTDDDDLAPLFLSEGES